MTKVPLARNSGVQECGFQIESAFQTGTVFQVQRWSTHDGDGIRSTVFLKGCPLRCAWCANPESWNPAPEHGFGWNTTVRDVMKTLRRDEIFYRESGGGVTFSGGEPFAQGVFLRALLKECRALGYSTAVETCGFFDWDDAADIFKELDSVFIDIKQMDPEKHQQFTGVSNERILQNIRRVVATHDDVTVRVPLVKGVNDDPGNILALCSFLEGAAKGLRGIEFLPYHNLGDSKYRALSLAPSQFEAPASSVIEALEALVKDHGITVIK